LEDSCITGKIIPEHSIGDEFWVRVRSCERSLYAGTKTESARFFREKFVTQMGGFDEDTLSFKIEGIGMKRKARITSYIPY
jgi:hypothetical protein